jgi:mannose-6-phosphate isomerase
VYDYERQDADGNFRELHIKQSIDVTRIPHIHPNIEQVVEFREGVKVTTFVKSEYFTVYKWEINGRASFQQDQPFQLSSRDQRWGSPPCKWRRTAVAQRGSLYFTGRNGLF